MGAAGALTQVLQLGIGLKANEDEGRAKEAEAQDNARLAHAAAADAVARGQRESGQLRMRGTQVVGEQKLAYANSGVDASQGTAANVMADTRMLSELDAKTAENNATREAMGFKTYGTKYAQQAQLEASRTRNRAAGAILGTGGRLASWYGSNMGED